MVPALGSSLTPTGGATSAGNGRAGNARAEEEIVLLNQLILSGVVLLSRVNQRNSGCFAACSDKKYRTPPCLSGHAPSSDETDPHVSIASSASGGSSGQKPPFGSGSSTLSGLMLTPLLDWEMIITARWRVEQRSTGKMRRARRAVRR